MSRVLPPLIGLTLVLLFGSSWWNRPVAALAAGGTRTARTPAPGPERFLKGQLHLHTNNSGDGHQSPAEVMRWYEARGYDFLVFTDHSFITLDSAPEGELLAIPGVELTANLDTCLPAPPPGLTCNLHVNALFVDAARTTAAVARTNSTQRLDVYAQGLEQSAALGALAQINHPNFRYGADGPLLTELARRGARLMEIANEASDSTNEGDARHPSTEALWDEVTTSGQTLFGVASDDAHDFDPDAAQRAARGGPAYPGDLGFVMVRATKDPAHIRAALERGDFYASTGVLLERLDTSNGALSLATANDAEFRFIGDGGRVLATSTGRSARFELEGSPTHYVRAVVTDGRGKRAWTQPLRSR